MTSYSSGACQQNGLVTANCCNLFRLSVRVALKNRVCLFFVSESNMTDKSSAKLVSSKRSASSNTYVNKSSHHLLPPYNAFCERLAIRLHESTYQKLDPLQRDRLSSLKMSSKTTRCCNDNMGLLC